MITLPPILAFRSQYAWLSNFHPCEVRYCGLTYPSVEHAYQAAKTLSSRRRLKFTRYPTAAIAKRKGKALTLRPHWGGLKERVMLACLRSKFTSHKALRIQLLATGSAHLEEGNTWGDSYWGTYHGQGRNRLGVLLMQVREEILNGELAAGSLGD